MNYIENCDGIRPESLIRGYEYNLIRKAKEGDNRAFEELLKSCEGQIANSAKGFFHRQRPDTVILTMKELIHAGNEGAWEAVRHFDESYGKRFMEYAIYWINVTMMVAIRRNRVIPKKSAGRKMIRMIYGTMNQFYALNGRQPTYEEIADILNKDAERQVSPQDIEHEICSSRATTSPDSLSRPIHHEDWEGTVDDVMADHRIVPSDRSMLATECGEIAKRVLAQIGRMQPRHEQILKRRYGIGGRKLTHDEIGRALDVSKQNVQQTEVLAMKRVRKIITARYKAEDFSF